MSFKDTFCPSPWFSLRIRQNGAYEACRWGSGPTNRAPNSIQQVGVVEFYHGPFMSRVREKLLAGEQLPMCYDCRRQDSIGQLSGRWRQMLKIGVRQEEFANTLLSSPVLAELEFSNANSGETQLLPVDLQIDLGNFCNNSCIMCDSTSSSRVAADYIKLAKINPIDFTAPAAIAAAWTQDPAVLAKFIDELVTIPNIKYIHFLGGETLIIDAFWRICEALVAAGISQSIIIGTTTNGTLYDHRVEWLCQNFKEVHLGLSIETTTSLNDYVRYGSDIDSVLNNIKKFLALRDREPGLNFILRTTISLLTVYHYDKLVKFMLENRVTAESCNILQWPACLQVELLPEDLKADIISRLKAQRASAVSTTSAHVETSTNVRLVGTENQQTLRLIDETIELLTMRSFDDEYITHHRTKLATFLKSFEQLRNNNILEHLPEYEDFLRSIGY